MSLLERHAIIESVENFLILQSMKLEEEHELSHWLIRRKPTVSKPEIKQTPKK